MSGIVNTDSCAHWHKSDSESVPYRRCHYCDEAIKPIAKSGDRWSGRNGKLLCSDSEHWHQPAVDDQGRLEDAFSEDVAMMADRITSDVGIAARMVGNVSPSLGQWVIDEVITALRGIRIE